MGGVRDQIRQRIEAHWRGLGAAIAAPENWIIAMKDAPVLGRFGWM